MVFVPGRYEMLAANWQLTEHAWRYEGEEEHLSPEERRAHLYWTHVTSSPLPGEGLHVDVTPGSTEKELRARRINRGCLLSFRGCDGLCEILPDALSVLRDRNRDWHDSPGPPQCQGGASFIWEDSSGKVHPGTETPSCF